MVYIKEKKGHFKKEFSLLDLVIFGIGSTIGAGIFVLFGLGTQIAGSGILISFIIGAIITLFIALNYAELGTSMPITGGSYSFVREGIGGIIAFYVGWLIWLGSIVYCALSTIGFMQYLNYFIPFPFHDLFGAIIVLVFAALNIKGTKLAMKIQRNIVLALLCIFGMYIGAGFARVNVEQFSLSSIGLFPIFSVTALIFVCYTGFESITTVSEEVKKPKHIAYALIISIIIPALIYTAISYVSLSSVPIDVLARSKLPLIEMIRDNSFFIGLFFLAAILATLSSLNIALIAGSRNLFALSRDGYVPAAFSSIHQKYQTPYLAMLFTAILVILFIATRAIEFVAYVSNFGYIIAFSLVSLSLLILRKKREFLHRPFKLPFYPFFSILGIFLPLILLFFVESSAVFVGAVWMVVGFFIYTLHTLGIDRFRVAFSGINIIISIISFSFWYSLRTGFLMIKPLTKLFLSNTTLIIGFICLAVGILFLKKVTSQEK